MSDSVQSSTVVDAATSPRRRIELLVVFADLTRYQAECARRSDEEVADALDAHYARVSIHAERAGGRLVKPIGDAVLVVFPAGRADAAMRAMLDLKAEADEWFSRHGWRETRLVVKAHVGPVIAGDYGPANDRRFDVIGHHVNVAATLPSRDVSISVEAFRALSPETRKLFKKHTPPVVYIPLDGQRP